MFKLSYDDELRLSRMLLRACGMPEPDADLAGSVITHSDFTGVYSHGISRLTGYLRLFRKGAYNPRPKLTVIKDEPSVIELDCDNALGVVTVNRAFDMLLPKAREHGIAICTGRRSSNIGCASYYGWRAAENDVIAVVCCNTYLSMAPFGGAERLIGTNPIVIGVPTRSEYPIVMDISTSGVAMGKIKALGREGKELPPGWANDIDGRPTTDPDKAYTVLPIARHKGYGLAVMVDIVCGVLSGACFGRDIGSAAKGESENTGFCMIIIDPAHFMPIEDFKRRADEYVRMMKHSRPADGVEEIFLPGEIEFRYFENARREGIDVSVALQDELITLAVELGVVPPDSNFSTLVDTARTVKL